MEPLGPAKLTIPYYGASVEIIDEISFELAIKMMDSIKQRLEIEQDVKADNEDNYCFKCGLLFKVGFVDTRPDTFTNHSLCIDCYNKGIRIENQ